jgi:hypothetical protein
MSRSNGEDIMVVQCHFRHLGIVRCDRSCMSEQWATMHHVVPVSQWEKTTKFSTDEMTGCQWGIPNMFQMLFNLAGGLNIPYIRVPGVDRCPLGQEAIKDAHKSSRSIPMGSTNFLVPTSTPTKKLCLTPHLQI